MIVGKFINCSPLPTGCELHVEKDNSIKIKKKIEILLQILFLCGWKILKITISTSPTNGRQVNSDGKSLFHALSRLTAKVQYRHSSEC